MQHIYCNICYINIYTYTFIEHIYTRVSVHVYIYQHFIFQLTPLPSQLLQDDKVSIGRENSDSSIFQKHMSLESNGHNLLLGIQGVKKKCNGNQISILLLLPIFFNNFKIASKPILFYIIDSNLLSVKRQTEGKWSFKSVKK